MGRECTDTWERDASRRPRAGLLNGNRSRAETRNHTLCIQLSVCEWNRGKAIV